jgi:hypothetical protein
VKLDKTKYVMVLKCRFDGERLLDYPFSFKHDWIYTCWDQRDIRVSAEHDCTYAVWAVTTYNGTEYALHGDYIVRSDKGLVVVPKTVFEVYFSD